MSDNTKLDRRVRRTRQLLRDALIALIAEKGYEHVTVQDILDRADVGRSTFYAHYRDKEELLVSGFDESFAAFTAATTAATPPHAKFLEPARVLFAHADEHRSIWKALVGKQSSEIVLRYLRERLSQVIAQHFREQIDGADDDPVAFSAAVQYTTHALVGILTWWAETDAPYTPDELHRLFLRLSTQGIKRSLSVH